MRQPPQRTPTAYDAKELPDGEAGAVHSTAPRLWRPWLITCSPAASSIVGGSCVQSITQPFLKVGHRGEIALDWPERPCPLPAEIRLPLRGLIALRGATPSPRIAPRCAHQPYASAVRRASPPPSPDAPVGRRRLRTGCPLSPFGITRRTCRSCIPMRWATADPVNSSGPISAAMAMTVGATSRHHFASGGRPVWRAGVESGQSQHRGTYELTNTFSGRGRISPRSTRRTWRVIISLVGAGTPALAPSAAMKPFISSISVRRPFAMSCAIEGR